MELSDTFGGQVKLPYSTGLIWSHCLLNKEIKDNFRLSGWFYKRDEDSKIIKQTLIISFNDQKDLFQFSILILSKITIGINFKPIIYFFRKIIGLNINLINQPK